MTSLRVGLSSTNPYTVVGDARRAEELGFDYLGCGEHLFFHHPIANAFVQLAAAAGATERIGLVSTITLLPLYPAALAAKLAVTLDQVSGGRFELGVGAGGEYPPEFTAAGVDHAARFRRLDEHLDVLDQLCRGVPTTFRGRFTELDGVALDPPPSRRLPLWMGGRREGAMRRAGRRADVWMPYLVEPARLEESLRRVREHAVDAGRAPDSVHGAVFLWTHVDEDARRSREIGIGVVSAAYAQDFRPLADRYLVLGDPETVAARIGEHADAGASRVIVHVASPSKDRAAVVELFAREVLPRLRSRT